MEVIIENNSGYIGARHIDSKDKESMKERQYLGWGKNSNDFDELEFTRDWAW